MFYYKLTYSHQFPIGLLTIILIDHTSHDYFLHDIILTTHLSYSILLFLYITSTTISSHAHDLLELFRNKIRLFEKSKISSSLLVIPRPHSFLHLPLFLGGGNL